MGGNVESEYIKIQYKFKPLRSSDKISLENVVIAKSAKFKNRFYSIWVSDHSGARFKLYDVDESWKYSWQRGCSPPSHLHEIVNTGISQQIICRRNHSGRLFCTSSAKRHLWTRQPVFRPHILFSLWCNFDIDLLLFWIFQIFYLGTL